MFGLFKKPIWAWIEKESVPAYSIFSGAEDYLLRLTRNQFHQWLQAHSIIHSDEMVWPEEYLKFANQLQIPFDNFRSGRVRKRSDRFYIYGLDHDGNYIEPETAYTHNSQLDVWEEIPMYSEIEK